MCDTYTQTYFSASWLQEVRAGSEEAAVLKGRVKELEIKLLFALKGQEGIEPLIPQVSTQWNQEQHGKHFKQRVAYGCLTVYMFNLGSCEDFEGFLLIEVFTCHAG